MLRRAFTIGIVSLLLLTFMNPLSFAQNRKAAVKQYKSREGVGVKHTVTNISWTTSWRPDVDQIKFAGEVSRPPLFVRYQAGLEELAEVALARIVQISDQLKNQLGLELRTDINIETNLLRVDVVPQSLEWVIENDGNVMMFPLFTTGYDAPSAEVDFISPVFPERFIHEIVEANLAMPGKPNAILMDLFNDRGKKIRTYTRWYRDGFAEYAGWSVGNHYRMQTDVEEPSREKNDLRLFIRLTRPDWSPFTDLSRIGATIFQWNQFDPSEGNTTRYGAALGIFLLLEHKFGPGSVKKVARRVSELGYPDRDMLVAAINDTFQTDLVQLVKDFTFPDLGMKLEPLTPAKRANNVLPDIEGIYVNSVEPASMAEVTGIRPGQVITMVGDREATSRIQLELGLLDIITGKSENVVKVFVPDVGEVIYSIPLD